MNIWTSVFLVWPVPVMSVHLQDSLLYNLNDVMHGAFPLITRSTDAISQVHGTDIAVLRQRRFPIGDFIQLQPGG